MRNKVRAAAGGKGGKVGGKGAKDGAKGRGRGAGRGRGRGKGAPVVGPRERKKIPVDTIHDIASLADDLPIGARLYKDSYNNTFRVFYKGMSQARAWPLRGARLALCELFQFAWYQAARYGEECHVENVCTLVDSLAVPS